MKIKIITSSIDMITNHEKTVNEFIKDKLVIKIDTIIHHNYQATSNGRILSIINYNE